MYFNATWLVNVSHPIPSYVGEERNVIAFLVLPTFLPWRLSSQRLNCKYQNWQSNQYQSQQTCCFSTSHGFSVILREREREREREIFWRAWIFRREKLLVLHAFIYNSLCGCSFNLGHWIFRREKLLVLLAFIYNSLCGCSFNLGHWSFLMELIKNFGRYKIDLDSIGLIIWDNKIRCGHWVVIESQTGEVTILRYCLKLLVAEELIDEITLNGNQRKVCMHNASSI